MRGPNEDSSVETHSVYSDHESMAPDEDSSVETHSVFSSFDSSESSINSYVSDSDTKQSDGSSDASNSEEEQMEQERTEEEQQGRIITQEEIQNYLNGLKQITGGKRYKRYILTINEKGLQESDKQKETWQRFLNQENIIKKLVAWAICAELGEENQRFHIHLFIHTKDKISPKALVEFLNIQRLLAHIDVAKGENPDIQKYLTKDPLWYMEFNMGKEKTARSKATEIALQKLGNGYSVGDIIAEQPTLLPFYNQLSKMKKEINEKQIPDSYPGPLYTKNLIITGATGVGKTSTIIDFCSDYGIKLFRKDTTTKWFPPDYDPSGNNLILVDDIPKDYFRNFETLVKQWCDHTPAPAEIKGDIIKTNPKDRWVFTSNYTFRELLDEIPWNDQVYNKEAFLRRFTVIELDRSITEKREEESTGVWTRIPQRDMNEFLDLIDTWFALHEMERNKINTEDVLKDYFKEKYNSIKTPELWMD